MVTTLTAVILAAVQLILQFFGVSIGKDGVSINWKRILLWAILSPVLALVAGRIVSVFSDCVTMFQYWSGNGGEFSLGLVPRFVQSLIPTASNVYQIFVASVFKFFAIDRVIGLSLQILAIRIFLKNSERVFSAITATVHTAISVMSK